MKKFIHAVACLALMVAMPMCVASCSDDDDDDSSSYAERTEALYDVIDVYIENVVYPTYTNLANATTELYNELTSLQTKLEAGTLTDGDVEDACDIFLEARAYWEKSEAWLYGPADVLGIDPHIDTWPLDRDELAQLLATETMRSKVYGDDVDIEDAIVYISEENGEVSHLGFHGVEFILFRDGEPRTAADLEGYETDDAFTANTVLGAYEVAYARAVAGDLRDWTSLLEYAWMGSQASLSHIARCTTRGFQVKLDGYSNFYGEEILNTGSSEYFATPRYTIATILVDGCSNICAEVADQKMGQPYRAAAGTATSAEKSDEEYVGKEYIESPYSHMSFTDFYDNICSIKNALYGNIDKSSPAANSIMAYLQSEKASLAEELEDDLDDALEALNDCINYGMAFVTIINSNDSKGMSYVAEAMDEITELDAIIQEVSDWISKN